MRLEHCKDCLNFSRTKDYNNPSGISLYRLNYNCALIPGKSIYHIEDCPK